MMISSELSPSIAARELLIRRRARSDILHYVNAIDVPGRPIGDGDTTDVFQPVETTIAPHHQLILHAIDECSRTPHGRLMIFCPPGSAKSTYASQVFPSRYLAEQPRRLILTSYGDSPAKQMGRKTRAIIKQKKFQRLYPNIALLNDSNAAHEFGLSNGSEYMASSILGSVTSRRADGIIIDDPVKGHEAADSPVIREKTWNAYQEDILTRLVPGGWVCLIQTRWQEDDLAGRILPEKWAGESGLIKCRDGNMWRVLCLQARCEVANDPLGRAIGEYLWPEWFTQAHWAQYMANKRMWSALFQQLPRPLEGLLFSQGDLLVDGLPIPFPAHCDAVYAVIDTAFKTGDRNDGTAVTYFARNKFAGIPLIVLDYDYVQIEGDLLIKWLPSVAQRCVELSKLCHARLGLGVFLEDKASGIILLQHGKRIGLPVTPIPEDLVDLGKDNRGLAVAGYAMQGQVKITVHAYNKVVSYKGEIKNHLLSQILGYRLGIPNQADDCYDTFVYGLALGLNT